MTNITKANKRKITPQKKTIKSKLKKHIKTRLKKIDKKTAKLPAFMTDKHALKHYRFALKYVELDLNATQAYLAIYGVEYEETNGKKMSARIAAVQACKLLVNNNVQTHVKELVTELLIEDRNNAKTIIARYANWADSDITDYLNIKIVSKIDENGKKYTEAVPQIVDLKALPKDLRKNIKSISFSGGGVKFELVDKKGSNDQLAKLAGLDKERTEEREIHIHFDKQDENLL